MKTRNREINIFSMSALDLFASALGAFILIALITLPFFPNLSQSPPSPDSAKLERENAELKREKAKLEQEKDRLEREMKAREKEAQKAKDLEEQVEALRREIDDTAVLLGISTKAKKIAMVIDMSGSIYQAGKQDYRQFIRLSVQAMLDAFRSKSELCLIGFHAPNERTRLHYWPENRQYFQLEKYAHGRVISAIDRWMSLVAGGTPTREALLAAIELRPEAIILLSDGAPSEDWRDVVAAITRRNTQRIPIHAAAVGNYVGQRDFIDFLVQLTNRNGGTLVGAKPG